MIRETINPTPLSAGRAGICINGLEPFDASDSSAAAGIPQVSIIIARKYRLEPVIARLVCHLAGIGIGLEA